MVNWNDSKYLSINDIKSEKKSDGTNFFSDKELGYFDDPLIENKVDNAKKVAELVEKVRKLEAASKKEEALFNEVSLERTDKSLAYKVINLEKARVDVALFRMTLWMGNADKTDAERKQRTQELDKKITDNNIKRTTNDKLIREFKENLKEAEEEKARSEKLFKTRNNLQVILQGSGKLVTDDNPDGIELTSLTTTYTIKDYSGDRILVDDDSTITNTINGRASTITEIITHANDFLLDMNNINVTRNADSFEDTKLSLYNSLTFNSKNMITSGAHEMGATFLRVLRDIGAQKLKDVIDNSGSLKITKLKKNIEELLERIYLIEGITGEKEDFETMSKYEEGDEDTIKEIMAKYDRITPKLLQRDFSFYEMAPNWQNLFEFMKEVFPWDPITRKLKNPKKYLTDPNDTNFIKPKDGGKGWKGLTLGGYTYNPEAASTKNDPSKKAVVDAQRAFGPQKEYKKIEDDTDFKTLVEIWWEVFSPFMEDKVNSNKNDWAIKHRYPTQTTYDDESYQKMLNTLRYARTMRKLLLEMGISSKIDDYDAHLLRIGDQAERGSYILPDRSKAIQTLVARSGNEGYNNNKVLLAAQNNKIWTDVGNWKDYASTKLLQSSITDISVHENRIKAINDKITAWEIDNANYDFQIRDWELEKKMLQDWEDFKEKDLPNKKVDFETMYAKGKWTWNQVGQMLRNLELIKTEMNDDAAFETEFKDKKTALEKKQTDAGLDWARISQSWDLLKREKGDQLSEAIKAIIKDEKGTGITLADLDQYFQNYTQHLELESTQKDDWKKIQEAKKDPTKYDDPTKPPVVELKPEDLKVLMNAAENPSQDITDKWKKVLSGTGDKRDAAKNTIKTHEDIGKLINKTGYDKKDSTVDAEKKKFGRWEQHLRGHAYGDAKSTKDSGDEQWNEFIKKDPKVVIGAILYFDYEESGDDKIKETKAAMKKAKEDKEKETNVEKVEDSWDETEQKDMTKYLYRTAVGKELFDQVKTKTGDEPSPKNQDETKEPSWFKFRSDNIWRPLVTYGGGLILILAVVGAVFWKNIAEWWNGPAEEEGEIGEDEKSEDDNE